MLHFDGIVFDTGEYRSLREYEKLRPAWLAHNPGKDQDDYDAWYRQLEEKRLEVHTN